MNAALRAEQLRHDHELPPDNDGADEYLAGQVELLMKAEDSDLVPFFSTGAPFYEPGFDEAGTDAIAEADGHESPLLQLVLAVLGGRQELAARLAEQFREPLQRAATRLITTQQEKDADA